MVEATTMNQQLISRIPPRSQALRLDAHTYLSNNYLASDAEMFAFFRADYERKSEESSVELYIQAGGPAGPALPVYLFLRFPELGFPSAWRYTFL